MKKILLLLTLTACGGGMLQAQNFKGKIDLAVHAAGGYSSLSYKFNTDGSAGGKFGTDFGLSCAYKFTPNFGLQSGLNLATYKASLDVPIIEGSEDYGQGNNAFNYRYSVSGYKDDVSALYLNIPVLAQYTQPLSRTIDILTAAGFKVGIPLSAKYDAATQNTATSGYYFYEGQEYTNVPENGFFPGMGSKSQSGSADFGISLMLSVEAGAKFMIDEKFFAYAGLFFDYGLNSVQKGSGNEPVAYNMATPAVPVYNDISSTNVVKSIRPIAVGLKLKFGISL